MGLVMHLKVRDDNSVPLDELSFFEIQNLKEFLYLIKMKHWIHNTFILTDVLKAALVP